VIAQWAAAVLKHCRRNCKYLLHPQLMRRSENIK